MSIDKYKKIQKDLNDTMVTTTNIVSSLLDRGEKINSLNNKSKELSDKSVDFENQSDRVTSSYTKNIRDKIIRNIMYWWCEFKVWLYTIYKSLIIYYNGIDIQHKNNNNSNDKNDIFH